MSAETATEFARLHRRLGAVAREQRFPDVGFEQVDLVEHLDDGALVVIDAELFQDFDDVVFLRVGLVMREISHVQDQVGLQHLFERGAERGDELCGKVGDKADRVGEDDAPA